MHGINGIYNYILIKSISQEEESLSQTSTPKKAKQGNICSFLASVSLSSTDWKGKLEFS